ncbi:MAG: hypothetical protein HY092_01015 [Candidatus Kerfeldbacteria bacterium]|nr:hypothetical protein [Candidatus Kerfeldbacteria bacterium]
MPEYKERLVPVHLPSPVTIPARFHLRVDRTTPLSELLSSENVDTGFPWSPGDDENGRWTPFEQLEFHEDPSAASGPLEVDALLLWIDKVLSAELAREVIAGWHYQPVGLRELLAFQRAFDLGQIEYDPNLEIVVLDPCLEMVDHAAGHTFRPSCVKVTWSPRWPTHIFPTNPEVTCGMNPFFLVHART